VLVDSGNAKLVGETIAAVMTAKVPRHRELIGGLASRLGVNPDGSMAVNDDPSGVINAQVRCSVTCDHPNCMQTASLIASNGLSHCMHVLRDLRKGLGLIPCLIASLIACRCSVTSARVSASRLGQVQAAVVLKEAPTRALALACPACLAAPVQCRGAGAGVAAPAAAGGAKAAAPARAMPRRRVWLSYVGGRRRASSLPRN